GGETFGDSADFAGGAGRGVSITAGSGSTGSGSAAGSGGLAAGFARPPSADGSFTTGTGGGAASRLVSVFGGGSTSAGRAGTFGRSLALVGIGSGAFDRGPVGNSGTGSTTPARGGSGAGAGGAGFAPAPPGSSSPAAGRNCGGAAGTGSACATRNSPNPPAPRNSPPATTTTPPGHRRLASPLMSPSPFSVGCVQRTARGRGALHAPYSGFRERKSPAGRPVTAPPTGPA